MAVLVVRTSVKVAVSDAANNSVNVPPKRLSSLCAFTRPMPFTSGLWIIQFTRFRWFGWSIYASVT